MDNGLKKILELVAGLGFGLTGTDQIFTALYDAVDKPAAPAGLYPLPAPDFELLRILLLLIGAALLGHFLWSLWKENSGKSS